MKRLIQAVLVIIPLLALSTGADEILSTVTIDTWGLLSKGRMVYMDYHYVTTTTYWAEVIMVDLTTKAKTTLFPTDGRTFPYYLAYGFSGDHLAYVPYNASGGTGGYAGGATCYLYDRNVCTGATKQLTSSSAWKEMVWVAGNIVVWVDYRNRVPLTQDSLNSEIYLYDLAAEQERRITSDHAYQSYPCTDGVNLVWIDYEKGYGRLFLRSLGTGETREINEYPAGKNNPRLNGRYVVWEDYRHTGSNPKNVDVYGYDIETDQVVPVCLAPGFQGRIFVSGTRVVWEDYRNAVTDSMNADVYGYDFASGTETPFIQRDGYQAHPTLSGDTLCWFDKNAALMTLQLTRLPASGLKGKTNCPALIPVNPSISTTGLFRTQGLAPCSRVEIRLLDMAGRCLVSKTGYSGSTGRAVVDLGLRPPHAMYGIRLTVGSETSFHKVLVW